MKERSPVLIVGSLAFDDLEMPYGSFKDVVGGAATYSSIAASLLAPVRLVGIIGQDFEQKTLDILAARGVDLAGVERAGGKTFRWAGRYSSDLVTRETLDTQLNVFADFRPKIPEAYRRSPFVLLGNIHPALQVEVLDQVERPEIVVADTMNFWISGERAALGEMLRRVDLLVINDEEARQLAGCHNLRRAATAIRALGPRWLIVKRGEHGALLFDDLGMFFVPAYPLEDVKDPTGAGDSFAGGLVGYLASHGHVSERLLRRAMFFASAMGSFCVEDVGPRRLLEVRKEDLRRRLDAFVHMIDYGGDLPFAEVAERP